VNQRQPIFNAPAVVVTVLAAFVLVFFALDPEYGLLPDIAGEQLFYLLEFSPMRLAHKAREAASGRVVAASQFITHIFVHGGATHLIVNSAWFLAFATPIARRLGTARFLAFFFLCGIGGALLFLPFNTAPMVGASGAICGLMGAALRFLFLPLMAGDTAALAGKRRAPLLSLPTALSNWRILAAIAFWTIVNVVAARVAPWFLQEQNPPWMPQEPRIAWEAHLGGFFTGLLTFGLFDSKPPVHRDSTPAE
jgi:membrane associated rhomboid family serine protease